MANSYDFAIFGGGALSALLAGLLAHDHGKSVIRIAELVSVQRLPRAIDIALPLATRPETWRLLQRAEAETRTLLAGLSAADAIAPTRVKIVADLPGTRDALAHISHMAPAYGQRVHDGLFTGVSRLQREVTLTDSKVQAIDRADVAFDSSGMIELRVAGERMGAGQVVLANDSAILDLLPESQRPAILVPQAMMATLTAPARRLAAPVMRFPDRGVTLVQRQDLGILALVSGDSEVDARLSSCLPGPFPLSRRATSHFRRLGSRDGAPVIGRLPSGPFIVAGLGEVGAFLAAPLARFLAGKASDDEADWFAAHDPARTDRVAIADFVAAGEVLP